MGGKPRAGLASMNLGELVDWVSTAEQLFEVLGENNKEEEVEARLVEGRVTLDRADNNDNADNANLNITFSYDLCNDNCQTLEDL